MYQFSDSKQEPKEIEIITGNGKDLNDLNISPVNDYIEIEKPKQNNQNKKNIIVPTEKNKAMPI